MIWPFSKIAELEERAFTAEIQLATERSEMLEANHRASAAAVSCEATLSALTKECSALKAELEALKKRQAPEGPFMTCDCGSHAFITGAHLIGWKKGEVGMVPVPLGATVQCRQCARLWHVDDGGMEVAKRVVPPQEERQRKPARDDSDLRW